ncbi:MAG: TetR/AcrR family transcriptional regulator [Psychromonas sp.]|nr:TetR/AcrR family transcriptional regulator [Psychromonas sp.]
MKITRPGRPTRDTKKQAQLISAARELFIASDYDQVSTRKIATYAGVDAALIRYYFGSKMQLFIAMIRATTEPIFSRLAEMQLQSDEQGPAQILLTYYQVMTEYPDFPKLIFKLANMDCSNDKNRELWQLLSELLTPTKMDFFAHLKNAGRLQEGVDPDCARMSFLSLMVFPFLMPEKLKKIHNIEFTDSFLMRLAEQNIQLLNLGLLKPQDKNNDEK